MIDRTGVYQRPLEVAVNRWLGCQNCCQPGAQSGDVCNPADIRFRNSLPGVRKQLLSVFSFLNQPLLDVVSHLQPPTLLSRLLSECVQGSFERKVFMLRRSWVAVDHLGLTPAPVVACWSYHPTVSSSKRGSGCAGFFRSDHVSVAYGSIRVWVETYALT